MKTLLSNLLFVLVAGAITIGIATVAYKISPPAGNKADVAGIGQSNKDSQQSIGDQNNQLQNTINNVIDTVKQAAQSIKVPKAYTRIRSEEGDDNESEDEDDEGGSYAIPSLITPPSGLTQSYTASQVAGHNSKSNCWSSINGYVYDLTSWISQHPGGEGAILSICGVDGSAAFNGQHGSSGNANNILQSYLIGSLK